MPIINKKRWDIYVKENKGDIGGYIIRLAYELSKLLDIGKHEHLDNYEIIEIASSNIGDDSPTGYMAECAAKMIIECHSKGKEFLKKWNLRFESKGKVISDDEFISGCFFNTNESAKELLNKLSRRST
jgi:hypothetical protein